MKRAFKKAISVFLVVAMLLCAAPLNGFVGLELPSLFDFTAKAAEEGEVYYTCDNGGTAMQLPIRGHKCADTLQASLNRS